MASAASDSGGRAARRRRPPRDRRAQRSGRSRQPAQPVGLRFFRRTTRCAASSCPSLAARSCAQAISRARKASWTRRSSRPLQWEIADSSSARSSSVSSFGSFTQPEGSALDDSTVAERTIPLLEELGDDLGLAKAWWLKSEPDVNACRWGARAEALERALEHARRSGDAAEVATITSLHAQALYYGPTPVPDAIEQCERYLAEHPENRSLEASVTGVLAGPARDAGRLRPGAELAGPLPRAPRRARSATADRECRGDPGSRDRGAGRTSRRGRLHASLGLRHAGRDGRGERHGDDRRVSRGGPLPRRIATTRSRRSRGSARTLRRATSLRKSSGERRAHAPSSTAIRRLPRRSRERHLQRRRRPITPISRRER